MIASHQHRFIFLKTRKTAGTSLEIALSRVCGPLDVITKIAEPDEVLRAEAGGRAPQNFTVPPLNGKVWAHVPAAQARRALGREAWSGYFKFAVERNPWDAVVSLYFWRFKDPDRRPPFDRFVNSGRIEALAQKNSAICRIRGRVALDHTLRHERLDQDIAEVWERLDLPGAPDLPHAKSGTRPKTSGGYRDLYTPATRDRVATVFTDVIDLLGYEF